MLNTSTYPGMGVAEDCKVLKKCKLDKFRVR